MEFVVDEFNVVVKAEDGASEKERLRNVPAHARRDIHDDHDLVDSNGDTTND